MTPRREAFMGEYIRWFDTVGRDDVDLVGGKCASLGELIQNLVPRASSFQ